MVKNRAMDIEGYIRDLFSNTGLADRVRKNPDSASLLRIQTELKTLEKETYKGGYDAGVRDTVLDAIAALETLSYRAGRKSCVETLRKVFEVPDSEGVNTYE